ncbi:phage portal protein [Actinacidiphila sp. DG2A-62]|uniref:phage portal protein n=1 Tax=Actinacidiphila sp. DG2A-62 TaxID=3108821 RepID=UPI002DB8C94F|nr:phage portal protein [Actinacidiphila sp. DG2A-62]MEC3993990.1 phage portal protein [Actinacidiphila sp. DG2A-62]
MGTSLLDPLRALRNATPPVPYALRGPRWGITGQHASPASQEAQMRAQGGNGTLYAIVDRIITTYAQVTWHLYRTAPSGKREDRVEVTQHAALDLLNSPNDFMLGEAFRETTQQHEELTGEQWWVIVKSALASWPLELWPVRPDRMRPVAHPTKYLTGYEYVGPSGEVIPLALDEVIFQRRPNPMDPYRGLGPVQTILVDLDSARFGREWNRAFFANSAEPGGVLQVDRRLDDDEFDELRARWAEQHRGVSAAHRVAILENGVTWQDRKYTNRDMQFVELSQVGREIIREAFGFPKPALGATDDVNRANADAAELFLARWLVVPRLVRHRALWNHRILPMYGTAGAGLEFDFDSPVPDDEITETEALVNRSQAAQLLVEAGAFGPEVLAAVGLPAMSFGAPDADPDRALLVDLVKGAPTLAPMILPMLGFDIPEQWRNGVPGGPQASAPAARRVGAPTALPAGPDPEAALRWVAVSEHDDDVCQPCADNDGHLYRNRAEAYKDYPGGSGYIHCVGAQYGNACRCKVVKRGKEDS